MTWKLSRTVLKPSRSGDAPAQAANRETQRYLPRRQLRQTIRERVFVGGSQAHRLFLDDLDLAFGRQAQHGEMFAHDVVPIRQSSFMAQGYERINFRRAPRRQPTSQQRNCQQEQRDHRKGQRISRAHVEQQRFYPPRQR